MQSLWARAFWSLDQATKPLGFRDPFTVFLHSPDVCPLKIGGNSHQSHQLIMHCAYLQFSVFEESPYLCLDLAHWRPCLISPDSHFASRLRLCNSLSAFGIGEQIAAPADPVSLDTTQMGGGGDNLERTYAPCREKGRHLKTICIGVVSGWLCICRRRSWVMPWGDLMVDTEVIGER